MQEYFKILGVSENASTEEIESAYKTLKEKYSRERFCEGEVGNEAAKNLTKLETAYQEIMDSKRARNYTANNESSNFSEFEDIELLIKKGNITAAQQKLDDVNERNAEWHYLQSVVFYKKNWINECKKQLEIALNMEPHNVKYADSYTKLKQKIEYNDKQFTANGAYGHGNGEQGGYGEEPRQMGGSDSSNCLTFCATWCCMDLMCSMCCR